MPAIRNKMPRSRRAGSILNGIGQFGDEWGDFGVPTSTGSGTATPSPSLESFLNFGSALIRSQSQSQPALVQPSYAAANPVQNPMMVPLLVAAGLAAVFILTRK